MGGEIGGAIRVAFAVAGIVAAFTAASYAELVSKFPLAGGAALFVHRAFRTPLLTFLIAFAVMCSGVASVATPATAFGGDHLSEFVDLPTVLVGLVDSDGPLLEVVRLGPLSMDTEVFSAIALFALVNGALMNLVMASRLVYGMAQQGIIPRPFGRVLRERQTPWAGIALIVQKLVEDTIVFAYAGGLLAFGLVRWLIARAVGGADTGEVDPEQLAG